MKFVILNPPWLLKFLSMLRFLPSVDYRNYSISYSIVKASSNKDFSDFCMVVDAVVKFGYHVSIWFINGEVFGETRTLSEIWMPRNLPGNVSLVDDKTSFADFYADDVDVTFCYSR